MASLQKIDGNRLYEYMMDFIRIGWRRPGTPEAHETAKFIVKKLKEFGLQNIKLEPFEMILYAPNTWKLTISGQDHPQERMELPCFPLWHTKPSEEEGTEAELVHVGFGTPKEYRKVDVKGKIVLVESKRMMAFYPTMDFFRAYEKARLKGAIGLIAIHDTPPGTHFATYATRHQTLKDSNLESGSIPGVVINQETGNFLKYQLLQQDLTANIQLKASFEKAMTDNLIAELPGKNEDDIILIGTHIDSWFDGAIDNAGGNAGFLELASFFSQIPEEKREKTMIFAGFAGHEVGSIGVIEFARKHGNFFNKISTYCMVDGFGSKGYVLESPSRIPWETGMDEARGLFTTENQVLFDIIARAVFKHDLTPAMHVSAVKGAFSDLGPLVAASVPSMMIISKGIFYHTIQDTADKVLPEQLERTAKAHAEILSELHSIPTDAIRKADRKGISAPNIQMSLRGEFIQFAFDITPNPMIEGTTALCYLTSYSCKNRIIVDLKWKIENGQELRSSPILPHRFGHPGQFKVKLTLIDNNGNEYSREKTAFVFKKKK
ncbi:MAG: M28 family peptidase [Candidatus Helarchaeales archaeon]